jgi:hypothetical protein
MLALCAAPAGCGSGRGSNASTGSTTSASAAPNQKAAAPAGVAAACTRIPVRMVSALVAGAGGRSVPLERTASSTAGRSVCRFRGRSVNVEAQLDAATRAVTRYFNRVTELLQFSSTNAKLRPVPVPALGDRGVPGGGANWVPFFDQLLSVRGERTLLVNFFVRGASTPALKRAAIRFTRLTYDRLGEPRGRHASRAGIG